MATIREIFDVGRVEAHKPNLPLDIPHIVPSKELIGIEVEIENVNVNGGRLNQVWRTEADGSLRNNGMEFVTAPIEAQYGPAALQNLLHEYLSQDCCFSPRTSVHVHLNVQDLTPEKVVDLVLLYVTYERLFYRFTGRGRQKNIYCVPLVDTDLLSNFANKRLDRNGWSKYTGLNLLPVQSYGTVEFRHMHGTRDLHKLTVWINLITKLKEYVRKTTTPTIRKNIAIMDDEYDFNGYLLEIFGEYGEYLKYSGVQDVNYLQAKQALSAEDTIVGIRKKASNNSAFYKFK